MNLSALLTHNEHYTVQDAHIDSRTGLPTATFVCGICKVTTAIEYGGAEDDLLSQACDDCVVRCWSRLEAVAVCIGRRYSRTQKRAAKVGACPIQKSPP